MKIIGNHAWILAPGLFCLLFSSCKEKKNEQQVINPEVNIVAAGQRDIPVFSEYTGQTLGESDIEIRARVDGWITGIHYKEGDVVRKGQLLYTIDDLPIRSRIDAAAAQVGRAKTLMSKAKADLDRVKPLADMNALSKRDLDAAVASYEAAREEVNISEAALHTANIELSYTRITAPVSGIIGISKVQIGDYVGKVPGVGEPLNTISSTGSMRVRFPVAEDEMLKFFKARQTGGQAMLANKDLPVNLVLSDGTLYPVAGRLDLANRQVDPETGSILIQAVFENKLGLLRPGQYVKVRFKTNEYKGAIVVPQQAVNQMQSIYQVYLVNDSNKVVPTVVKAGARVGSNWIITEGLKDGDKVAIVGNAVVNPKVPIKPIQMKWNYDSTITN
ncbi:efflux RND transporter periplasmic adaptor subunit [Flavihumibacter profundi]|uniref:efflux RND transporter periplasmic adaptor subunit n=1 Tax=Flavihumibacter profundi TaxID=2716883 RepID=UPI001CC472C2|nr:efflux RND transporter periplasmic adaptor subunit [Flavihumibacter profundi]MBZ5858218.1 efflux RND transporter periplasmic adaptor subunit [Flavihumibacter profundi]